MYQVKELARLDNRATGLTYPLLVQVVVIASGWRETGLRYYLRRCQQVTLSPLKILAAHGVTAAG
jgi:hypothetical protein